METVLSTLGLTSDAEALYRSVLRQAGGVVSAHRQALGWDRERTERAVEQLRDLGLMQQLPNLELEAVPPQSALRELVEQESARLSRRRRQLADASGAITQLVGELAGAAAPQVPSSPTISDDRIGAVMSRLARLGSGAICSVQAEIPNGPVSDQGLEGRALAALHGGRPVRGLYPIAGLANATEREWLVQWRELGEEQRLAENLPGEFIIYGTDAVLVRKPWELSTAPWVELREGVAITAFQELFEQLWAVAVAAPSARGNYRINDRLLSLLANGLKDEVIARYLGLGVRTVRRRIAELMVQLNVQTRFQLGAVAQERGLLRAER